MMFFAKRNFSSFFAGIFENYVDETHEYQFYTLEMVLKGLKLQLQYNFS